MRDHGVRFGILLRALRLCVAELLVRFALKRPEVLLQFAA
jgi:hypothetical protein